MDVIIIGKQSFSHSAAPHVIYCGQSRDEALAAVAKTAGKFPHIYGIDPQPISKIPAPAAPAPAAKKESPEPEASEPAPAPTKNKKAK